MTVLITGGSGLLGTEVREILTRMSIPYLAPSHCDMDILDRRSLEANISNPQVKFVFHAAAMTSPPVCSREPQKTIEANVIGTINVLDTCRKHNKKLVYISTDYVFDGDKGSYSVDDPINPINLYALTKAAAELAVRTYENTLVIRTSFCEKQFPYEKAFIDQFTSRDYVDVIAPLIVEASLSEQRGTVHIGTERKSVYELALRRSPDVKKLTRKQVDFPVPRDTSFKQEK
jgi:dTDP-4-dehydrorhamnose reductase|tara:strand:- start:1241 stop:1933 length:693 start_codon:yes stop_codon:yes gene_type:complete